MKMGNLNEEAWMDAAETRLIGALIGLARATDGNTVRTEETGRLMRAGLAALRKNAHQTLVEKIHAEKRILAPDCATCGAPCGKTADYDIKQWKNEAEPVREQKWLLLKRLVEVAVACSDSSAAASAAPDLGCAESSERMEREPQISDSAEVDYFLTKALFALGESWEAEWIAALVKEADHLITY